MSTELSPSPFLLSAGRWADETAGRLRWVLAMCADDRSENRQAQCEAEIRRRLENVPPSLRTRYLDELTTQFPTWDSGSSGSAPMSPRDPETGDEFIELLERVAPRWTEDEREKILEKFAELGRVGTRVRVPVVHGVPGGLALETVISERAARLSGLQTEFMATVDHLVWAVWGQIASRSGVKRPDGAELRVLFPRYLRGDGSFTDAQISQRIERTRQLLVALLGSLSQVSRGFVSQHLNALLPAAIEEVVRLERSGFTSFSSRCWAKYVLLTQQMTSASIQTAMEEVIASYVEEVILALPRSGRRT